MYALFLVLNETNLLEEILDRFVDVGVQGATILDSQGMASALAETPPDLPFFSAIRARFETARPYSKPILTALASEESAERTVHAARAVLSTVDAPGAGLMFSLPLGMVYRLE